MKPYVNNQRNIFTGKFKILSLHGFVQGQGWMLFKRYHHNSFTWEFEESMRLQFKSGGTAFAGKLTEHFADSPKERTQYAYYPSEKLLYIDRSDYAPGLSYNICINDRYRVEHIGGSEYRLYDLEDVAAEPDGYKFMIKIKSLSK